MKAQRSSFDEGKGFEELEVWKRSCSAAVQLYSLLKECRDFGFRDQMQRAAISIASNIAEGAERKNPAQFRLFLNYAKGSAAELRTQIYIALRVGILKENDGTPLIKELIEISRMLEGLRRSLLPKT